jgi:hypothetical protein
MVFVNFFPQIIFVVLLQANPAIACRMKLKYQAEIDALSPNFEGFSQVDNKTAFRWVFEDIKNGRNFLPTSLANPSQKIKSFKDWALSFFETEIQSTDQLIYYAKDKPKLYKKLGTHIAKGVIATKDGLCETACDLDGHFDHFEYEGIDFAIDNFTIIKKVAEG